MATTKYFAWFDKDSNTNLIAFGTEDEINNDRLTGESLELDYDEIYELKDILDDEDFGEDYLISTYISLNIIDKELLGRGFIKDKRLKNVGWG